MRFNFAIIGGGLTGTAMLYQFAEQVAQEIERGLLDPSTIKIQIFEKQDAFGPGLPHCDRNVMPFHITNMCARDMGILLDNCTDFQDWVTINQDKFKALLAGLDDTSENQDQCNHYPRAIMGEYLKERFQEAHHKAQALGLTVELYLRSEVIDLEERHDKIYLTVKNLLSGSIFSCVADRVLLATGHWFEKKETGNYFSSPWPAQNLLQNIPEGEKVAVIGTSLSAIEVVLTLTSDGRFIRDNSDKLAYIPSSNPRRFSLYSRRGLLPKVRGKMGGHKNRFLTREKVESLIVKNRGYLPLKEVFQLLNLELEAAYGHPINWEAIVNPTKSPAYLLQQYLKDAVTGDGPDGELIWQTVLYQSFDMIREIYLSLTLEDRRHFDKAYTSIFFTHAATQPIINAKKMLALMKSGIVEVFKLGKDYKLVKNDAKESYEFIYKDQKGNLKRDAYRYVVNARGQPRSVLTNTSPLMQNLLKRGLVQIGETQHLRPKGRRNRLPGDQLVTEFQAYKAGSIWIDPMTHQVIRQVSGKIRTQSNALYAVGAMTRGQIIDASMAYGIVQSTARVANNLVNDLKQAKVKSNR